MDQHFSTPWLKKGGTHACRAPEQADPDLAVGPYSDVWGFAATVLHLATGEQPYQDLTFMQMVTAMHREKQPAIPGTLPAWLHNLLKRCFSFDITKRPSVPQLLQVKLRGLCLVFHAVAMPSTSLQNALGCHRNSGSRSTKGKFCLLRLPAVKKC